ncbi:MAG: Yip1 family protein [Eubacteriales bacterium]
MDEKQSIFERIKLYIIKPKVFFEQYKENPKYLFHLIVITVMTIATALITKYVDANLVDNVMDTTTEGMTAEQVESFNTMVDFFDSPIMSVISNIALLLITVYVGAAIYYLIIKVIFKGEGTFNHMVLLTLVTTYPTRIMNLISSFSPTSINPTFTDTLLSYVNIPSIWSLVLIIVGTSILFKISMKKSAIIHCVLFLIGLAFTLGAYSLNTNLQENYPNIQ